MKMLMSMYSCSFIFSCPSHVDLAWLSSAILETCLQALKLATLSALPVPMLRQVYVEGFGGPKTAFSLGTSSKNGPMTMLTRC